ncbi:hypothetical protein BY996DRAFT_6649330 [Phakopsora pachyrhizi]|nr:hypothetical protein BY996DRAFT_6649330 [Phakopsora pachyrhizi]
MNRNLTWSTTFASYIVCTAVGVALTLNNATVTVSIYTYTNTTLYSLGVAEPHPSSSEPDVSLYGGSNEETIWWGDKSFWPSQK